MEITRDIIIIGAGGHGAEVSMILQDRMRAGDKIRIAGFLDDNPGLHGKLICGIPVLGGMRWCEDVDVSALRVICAIGSPPLCRQVVDRCLRLDMQFANAVSPEALIARDARIGTGVVIFPQVVVSTGVMIGDFSTLNTGVSVSHDSQVGRYCNLNPGARLAGGVRIGDGCYIGMSSSIIQNCSVGEWSIVGAGAAVVRDVAANTTVVGVPARAIQTREEGWHER